MCVYKMCIRKYGKIRWHYSTIVKSSLWLINLVLILNQILIIIFYKFPGCKPEIF